MPDPVNVEAGGTAPAMWRVLLVSTARRWRTGPTEMGDVREGPGPGEELRPGSGLNRFDQQRGRVESDARN